MVSDRVRTPKTMPTPSTMPTAVSRVRCALTRRFRRLRPEKRRSFTLPLPSALGLRLQRLDTLQDFILIGVPGLVHHVTVGEEDGPVGGGGGTRVVGHHEYGLIEAGRRLLEQPEHLAPGPRVQVPRRLVGEDDVGAFDQGPRDGHPLLLPTGELVRAMRPA